MINFFLKLILFKNIKRFINKILKRDIKIIGNYSSWLEAKNFSSGYDHKIIFDKSKESFLKVINGIAKYERDSAPFYSDNVNYALIKLLNSIQYKKKKTLNVLDFGGSFGSTYFQNLIFLKKNIDIVLFSGVLQYLSDPFYYINLLLKKKIKNFLILRTPFQINRESIKVQVIPDHLYRATLPIRIFNENLFVKFFKENNYSLKNNSFKSEMVNNIEFKNFLFKLKEK